MSNHYVPPEDGSATQHNNTESLAINNTSLRRLLTRVALKTTAWFYKYNGPCVPISKHLIVKTGRSVHLTEAATMGFVAANTSVPVPTVHCSFVHKNHAFIVMERVQGQTLPKALAKSSEAEIDSILMQLQQMLQELRALPPPPGTGVQSCLGGSLRDSRIPRSRPRFGPFKSIQDFHIWLRDGFRPEEHPDREDDDWKDIKDMVSKQDGPWPPPVFTHGDLNPSNIMVRDGRVVSIIDWEFAGWYPYYWEYTAAWYGNETRKSWQGVLARFLDPYPEELEMDKIRQRYWGDL